MSTGNRRGAKIVIKQELGRSGLMVAPLAFGGNVFGWTAEKAVDRARDQVGALIGASGKEIVWTSGATEAINLVAACWGRAFLKPGDEVVVSHMEHHSNIVPWQMACDAAGPTLPVIPISDAVSFG